MRNNIVLWLCLLVVGFLVGFVPEYLRARRFEQEVATSTTQLETCQLRDEATLMYLEAMQRNYGTSGDDASRFFDQTQRLANSTKDAALRDVLREILGLRDQITADLAKGNATVVSEMQPLLLKLEQGTKR
ncbi:MAG: hypothetical protein WCC37_08990 [Candidatus Sulfotelmatobacter sp.]|jgi:hypothetical protein